VTGRSKVELVELVGNLLGSSQGAMLRTALAMFLHAMMESQVTELCGASSSARARVKAVSPPRLRDMPT
jgi:hypothetical protein